MSDEQSTEVTRARAALGHGLAIAPVGDGGLARDLVWESSDGGRRLARVEGYECLAQDLTVALLTPLGSDPFDARFGFAGLSVLTLDVSGRLAQELLRLSVAATLLADARVVEADVALDAGERGSRSLAVVASIRSLLDRTQTIELGEVPAP